MLDDRRVRAHRGAELVPRSSRAPRAGRHELAVDNLSNHPLALRLIPSDPDEVLDFRLDATEFTAAPGTVDLRPPAGASDHPIPARDRNGIFRSRSRSRSAGTEQARSRPGRCASTPSCPAGCSARHVAARSSPRSGWPCSSRSWTTRCSRSPRRRRPRPPNRWPRRSTPLIKKDGRGRRRPASEGRRGRAKTAADADGHPDPVRRRDDGAHAGCHGPVTPTPVPLPSREVNFYKGVGSRWGPRSRSARPVPIPAGSVVRLTEIYIETPLRRRGVRSSIHGVTWRGLAEIPS